MKEIIWMEKPLGVESNDNDKLCLLQKPLYGLKQSPREWNEVISNYVVSQGFAASSVDPCIYVHLERKVFVGIYVDDIDASETYT